MNLFGVSHTGGHLSPGWPRGRCLLLGLPGASGSGEVTPVMGAPHLHLRGAWGTVSLPAFPKQCIRRPSTNRGGQRGNFGANQPWDTWGARGDMVGQERKNPLKNTQN